LQSIKTTAGNLLMEYSLSPSSFFVGDKVKLTVILDECQKINHSSFDITKIEKSESLTINNISLSNINGVQYLIIEFVPWQTGEVNFPSFKDVSVDIKLPTIKVPSILEIEGVQQILQDAREPILLDGTVFMLYKTISITVLSLLFFTFFIIFFKKRGKIFLIKLSSYYALFLFGVKLHILKRGIKKKSPSINTQSFYNDTEDFKKPLLKAPKRQIAENIWGKTYENALRKCLSYIYKTKDINWYSLTYKEMEMLIRSKLAKQEIQKQDAKNKQEEPDTSISDERQNRYVQKTELQTEILQNIKDIFQHLSLIRFAEKISDISNINTYCKEEGLILLSFRLITLHKKRKCNDSKCEISNKDNLK